MDEVLSCGCRMEERGIPYAQEFVAEIDCPIHGVSSTDMRDSVKVTTCTVVAHDGSVRLTVQPIRRWPEPRPAPIVLDFHPTDAAGVGCVLKALADEMRNRAGSIERMQADRDALDAALNMLHRPLDNA